MKTLEEIIKALEEILTGISNEDEKILINNHITVSKSLNERYTQEELDAKYPEYMPAINSIVNLYN